MSSVEIPSYRELGNGRVADPKLARWLDRRDAARRHRKLYEPDWRMCQYYLAGKQWIGWSEQLHRVVSATADPKEREREHYLANVLTQYVATILGKLYTDDFRPEITFRRDDKLSDEYASQCRNALRYAWDEEIPAREVLLDAILRLVTFGTAGVRCRYDSTVGAMLGQVPVVDGEPVLDPEEARKVMAENYETPEARPRLQALREGRICWEALSPDNILPPPGVDNERNFPWLIVERPVPISELKGLYPEAVEGLTEDDLETTSGGMHLREAGEEFGNTKLKGHVMVYTGYERPCPDYPEGEVFVFARDRKLDQRDELPYEVGGERKMGITFFHYHRIPGRFWGLGPTQQGIGPQRNRNRSRSQYIELKDRLGLGRVYARTGTINILRETQGRLGEVIEIPHGHDFPQETSGTGPGPWIEADIHMSDEDMDRVMGLREVSLGQAPAGVSAYSAMALLKEEDDRRVGPILMMIRSGVADLVKFTMQTMKLYWGPQKQIMVAGDQGMVAAHLFNATEIPMEYLVEVGEGPPIPRSAAAESQKISDIFDRSIQSGQPLPIDWYVDSLEQGKPLPLPKREQSVQREKAELENMLMMRGQMPQIHVYDDDMVHMQVHRAMQSAIAILPDQALQQVNMMIDQHVQAHAMAGQQKQATSGVPAMQGARGQEAQLPPGVPGPAEGQQGGDDPYAPGGTQMPSFGPNAPYPGSPSSQAV